MDENKNEEKSNNMELFMVIIKSSLPRGLKYNVLT